MPLQINRKALPLPDEQIGARLRRSRQHAKVVRNEIIFPQIVKPGMRHTPSRGTARHDLVVGDLRTLEYARKLLAKRPTTNSVRMQNCCVRGQTRPYSRSGMVL